MTNFWTNLLDLFSPRLCAGCKRRLEASEHVVCDDCLAGMSFTHHSQQLYDNQMARLFWGTLPVERAAAWFFYEPNTESAAMVHEMKYHGRTDVAEELGRMTAEELKAKGFFDGVDGIVPVPLSADRQQERGYNQSMHIAIGISRVTGLPIYNKVLERIQFNGSQTHLTIEERRENVAHAFRLKDGRGMEGHHLLIVDDVLTTGSTIMACGSQLQLIPDVRISIMTLGMAKS